MTSRLNTKDIGKCLAGLKPDYKNTFFIEKVNQHKKLLSLKVDSRYVSGTDTSCEMFGLLVYNILKLIPTKWRIYVTNNWVPSLKNPIDLKWAKFLSGWKKSI